MSLGAVGSELAELMVSILFRNPIKYLVSNPMAAENTEGTRGLMDDKKTIK